MNRQCERCNSGSIQKGRLVHSLAGVVFLTAQEIGNPKFLKKSFREGLVATYKCNSCEKVFGLELENFNKQEQCIVNNPLQV